MLTVQEDKSSMMMGYIQLMTVIAAFISTGKPTLHIEENRALKMEDP